MGLNSSFVQGIVDTRKHIAGQSGIYMINNPFQTQSQFLKSKKPVISRKKIYTKLSLGSLLIKTQGVGRGKREERGSKYNVCNFIDLFG